MQLTLALACSVIQFLLLLLLLWGKDVLLSLLLLHFQNNGNFLRLWHIALLLVMCFPLLHD